MTTTKARTATVTIAGQEVQCLMLPSGEFRIAVTQVWSLLQLSAIPTNATKDVKALLGGEVRYSITEKVSSDINSQAVNTITLDAFGLVLVAAAKKGNKLANEMCLRLVGASLIAIVSAAFGVKFSQEKVVQHVEFREVHTKGFHPKFTRWLKQDGVTGSKYAFVVNNLKRQVGLPLVSVDDYTTAELATLNLAEQMYDRLRTKGMTHTEALALV
jgi:hypothetical protein